MAEQKSPKRDGRNSGVRVWIFEGNFFCGALLLGIVRGLDLKPFALQKDPRKEPSTHTRMSWNS